MNRDIEFEVIGNTSPFSLMGESSCYMLTVNGQSYLVDCGSPIFPHLGYQGIADIKGIFATHSHEDHKRWFTDIVLFTFYNPLTKHKVRLVSSETILDEYAKNSKGALERSLSSDSKKVIDIPYENMVEPVIIGPRSKYFISLKRANAGSFHYQVEDRAGHAIGPEKAKIFFNPAATRPRLLFKDDESGEWVEPESFYCFESEVFYEKQKNVFQDDKAGLTVQAVKSTVWHGVSTIAFKFMTEENTLFFSADTVYKPSLWRELWEEYRPQKFTTISRKEFDESSVLTGDINDFIERTWSRERYEKAMSAYKGSVIIHDVARKNSIVHTDYPDIANAPYETIFFTHNPDNLTSWRPILTSRRKLSLRRGRVYELVKGVIYPYDADVYVHHLSGDFVGYQSEKGAYKVIEKDGLLGVVSSDDPRQGCMRVDLYQDIKGEYYPLLAGFNRAYHLRDDGKVEELAMERGGSAGRIVQNMRGKIAKPGPLAIKPDAAALRGSPAPAPLPGEIPASPGAAEFFKLQAYPKTALKVHLVWVSKYRRGVLTGQVATRARDVLRRIALERDVEIIAGSLSSDHVHLLIAYGPTQNVNQIAQWFKDTSSQMLLSEFVHLRNNFSGGNLWSRGYLAVSSENLTDETLRQYVEAQEGEPVADDGRFQIIPPSRTGPPHP
jgi:putative transposase